MIKCRHDGFIDMFDDDADPTFNHKTVCPECNKRKGDIFEDPNDIDPTCKVSQQPRSNGNPPWKVW